MSHHLIRRKTVSLVISLLLLFVTVKAKNFSMNAFENSQADNLSSTEGWSVTRKAPYLIYEGNPQEMTLLWQLTTTGSCTLDWGTDTTYALGSVQTAEYGDDHQHRYTFTGLQPATKYFYKVTAGSDIHKGSFRSAPADTASNLKFLVYGDTRSYPQKHALVAAKILETIRNDQDFQTILLSVGDLVHYGDQESYWDNEFFNPDYPDILNMLAALPYQSCRGNHEQSAVLFKKYFPYPFIGGRYWSFDYGSAHFAVVDQYTDYSTGSAQLNWLESDLATTTKPWKFLLFHEPGWSAGGHENEKDVQNYIQPLCLRYNVPVVFAGHNHYYSRAVVDDINHITTGGGGAPIYAADPDYPHVVTAAQVHHFCKINIENDLLYFTVEDINNNQIDYFVTNKYGILPHDVTVSNVFLPKDQDSLLLHVPVKNPFEHTIEVQALLIGKSGLYADSLVLYDDGNHGDDSPGDGLWGNYASAIPVEDEFTVDIAIADIDSGMYFQSPDKARFTTIGPLVLDHYRITSRDTIPHDGDKLKFEFFLRNDGSATAADNITSQIVLLDTFSIITAVVTSEYGQIDPGTIVAGANKQYIKFDLGLRDSVNVRFALNIYSNGYFFWSDTFEVFVHKKPTALDRNLPYVAHKYRLEQNFPNPFNPETHIQFTIPRNERVTLQIFNILGERVAVLVNERLTAGNYEYVWKTADQPSGIYYCQLKTGTGFMATQKLTLLK